MSFLILVASIVGYFYCGNDPMFIVAAAICSIGMSIISSASNIETVIKERTEFEIKKHSEVMKYTGSINNISSIREPKYSEPYYVDKEGHMEELKYSEPPYYGDKNK